MILLAAGQSVRFGSDKLKAVVEGEAMYESAISRFEAFQGFKSYVVTGKEEITQVAEKADAQSYAIKNRRGESLFL